MYVLFTEVNVAGADMDAARTHLMNHVVPRAREAGAKNGYWLAPENGRGISVVVFDSEEDARAVAQRLQVGQPPDPGAPPGITVTAVEVREVFAGF